MVTALTRLLKLSQKNMRAHMDLTFTIWKKFLRGQLVRILVVFLKCPYLAERKHCLVFGCELCNGMGDPSIRVNFQQSSCTLAHKVHI